MTNDPYKLTLRERFGNLVAAIRRKRHLDPWDEPFEPKPEACPRCSARIELRGDHWHCVGCKDRAEVVEYLAPNMPGHKIPTSVQSIDPCGWSGAASEFGKTWL